MQEMSFPSTYTLTKYLAEHLVAEFYCGGLPIAVVRPSMTGAIASEPLPGYIGNRGGVTGVTMAYAVGKRKPSIPITPILGCNLYHF